MNTLAVVDSPNPENRQIEEVSGDALSSEVHGPSTSKELSSGALVVGDEIVTVYSKSGGLDLKWAFPLKTCETWEDFKTLLRRACASSAAHLHAIENGHILVKQTDGAIVIPTLWENLVRGPWDIEVTFPLGLPQIQTLTGNGSYMSPMTLPPPPPIQPLLPSEEDGLHETLDQDQNRYSTSLGYKVVYLSKTPHGGVVHDFERTYNGQIHYDNGTSAGGKKKLPVLEETLRITRSSGRKRGGFPGMAPSMLPHSDPVDVSDQLESALIRPGDASEVSLAIHSSLLMNALRSVVKNSMYPASDSNHSLKTGQFPYPFIELYHHIDDLLEYADGSNETKARHDRDSNAECARHIRMLVNYLSNQDRVNLHLAKERWSRKIPVTTFASFWLLLKPGTDVYMLQNGVFEAFVIETFNGGPATLHRSFSPGTDRPYEISRAYEVRLWRLSFDGECVVRDDLRVCIEPFDGEREITSMPVIPCAFLDEAEGPTLRQQLVNRGRKYISLVNSHAYGEYTGKGLDGKEYDRTRIIVDMPQSDPSTPMPGVPGFMQPPPVLKPGRRRRVRTAPKSMPPPPPGMSEMSPESGKGARAAACECEVCARHIERNEVSIPLAFPDYDRIIPSRYDTMKAHQFFLCQPTCSAFILKTRSYDTLDVSGITEPQLQLNAIDRLVLKEEKIKTTLKAICQLSAAKPGSSNRPFYADFIRGKGEGHIILLHGPPGSGKTLTAESFAESQGRPLLSISAADLGHSAAELEESLVTFFGNAKKWGAIVLLDEADVYMEKRETHDLQRNSVVSVFLRVFDYFQGVLFLTTNRVGTFDEAFLSRIHVKIGYDPLSEDGRAKVWSNNFSKLNEDYEKGARRIDYEYGAKEYVTRSSEVNDLKLNGREIRNAFQTAVSLAVYDADHDSNTAVKLREHHLQQVIRMSAAFKEYIKSAHNNETFEDRAFMAGMRNDEYEHKKTYRNEHVGQSWV